MSSDDVYPKPAQIYVSITGLRLKNPFYVFRFFRHAVPTLRQARLAKGNLFAEVEKIEGVYYTLTAWQDETDMKRFLYRGAHRTAIRAFPSFANGKTYGFHANEVPTWLEARQIWAEKGKEYGS